LIKATQGSIWASDVSVKCTGNRFRTAGTLQGHTIRVSLTTVSSSHDERSTITTFEE
jgi:hypothetical protein